MSQDVTEVSAEYPAHLQTFVNRAQITQILYQTIIQGTARNQAETAKGVPASDAELLHSLSAAVAALTSSSPEERAMAWQSISNTAQLALQFFPRCSPTVNAKAVTGSGTTYEPHEGN